MIVGMICIISLLKTAVAERKNPNPIMNKNIIKITGIIQIRCQDIPNPEKNDNIKMTTSPTSICGIPNIADASGKNSAGMEKFLIRLTPDITELVVVIIPSLIAIQGANPHKNQIT